MRATRTLDETLDWINQLNDSIWKEVEDPCTRKKWWRRERRLTEEEWRTLAALIVCHEFICEVGCDGFGPCLVLHRHPQTPGLAPERLIMITSQHLPNPEDLRGDTWWQEVWEKFQPLAHSARNKELLKLYKLPPPKEYADCIY